MGKSSGRLRTQVATQQQRPNCLISQEQFLYYSRTICKVPTVRQALGRQTRMGCSPRHRRARGLAGSRARVTITSHSLRHTLPRVTCTSPMPGPPTVNSPALNITRQVGHPRQTPPTSKSPDNPGITVFARNSTG